MTSPSVFSVGALVQSDDPDTISPAHPSGSLTGKVVVAYFNATNGILPTATGWDPIVSADGNINSSLCALVRQFDGSETNPVDFDLAGAGLGAAALLIAYADCLTGSSPIGASGLGARASASTTITADDFTPTANGQGVVFFAVTHGPTLSAQSCSAYSGTGPTFTETFDGTANSSALSKKLGIHIAFGVQATAGATGARTATLANTPTENQGVMFSLKPVAALSSSGAGFFL